MGKNKYIKVDELWELFLGYKKEVKSNPRYKIEYVGKNGDRVETPIERPLTIEGFKTYCAYNASTIQHYWNNTDGAYDDYRTIITRIKEEIRAEQVDGGMSGFYNSNLTARINGLHDNQQVTTTSKIEILNNDPLDDSNDKS